jgi:hypothetical protein
MASDHSTRQSDALRTEDFLNYRLAIEPRSGKFPVPRFPAKRSEWIKIEYFYGNSKRSS